MKILFVATVVKTHIMEFHIPYLKMLKEMGWETAVAAKNDYDNPADCSIPFCDNFYDVPFERNPVKAKNITAYKLLKKIISEGDYDIIHCHTPVGAMLTRLAAKKSRKSCCKVIYTAHGFHFYKGAPLVNWMFYYPVEKYLSKYTDVLITINKEDYDLAKLKMKANRILYVPGIGVDTAKFNPQAGNGSLIRKELGIDDSQIVLLSVGELNKNKNHERVIRSIQNLNVVYVIVGRGKLKNKLAEVANSCNVKLYLVGYRNDVINFYSAADIYVLPSIREGLSLSLMEAMACGLPIACSKIRGNTDLIERNLFNPTDYKEIRKVIEETIIDRNKISEINLNKIKQFDINNTCRIIKDIYIESTKGI